MRKSRLFALIAAAALATPASVAAHPLGNFTINHLAKITGSAHRLDVRYVLDIAEIPTFQILHARNDGNWTRPMLLAWAQREAELVRSRLSIRENGEPVALRLHSASAALRPGAGGLPILRWDGDFSALLITPTGKIEVADSVYADRRIGWKDIVAGDRSDPTDELRTYPGALIGSPRRVAAASFDFSPRGIANIRTFEDAPGQSAAPPSMFSAATLSDMFRKPAQTPLFVLLTLLAAVGLGAFHGLEPGHGKALLAFTLVGARATARQAIVLATALTFAHTIGVLLLGLVLFTAAGFVSESVYPWISLISGAAIALIGARALASAAAARSKDARVTPSGADRPDAQPLRFHSAVWAAMSGGIAPCPAAIVLLLTALRLHHVAYGLLLIVLFGVGLAGILTAIGMAVVRGAARLSRTALYDRVAPLAPLFSASVISIIGAWTLAQGFAQQNAGSPPLLVAALVLLAVAAYAFTHRGHAHTHTHSHFGVEHS